MEATDFITLRRRCLALVEIHYRDPRVGPEWIASRLFVSRRQLDRAFAGRRGVAEMLARRRLAQVVAVAALNPTVPMADIAKRYGYSTYETFRAQCHRYIGCSPHIARSNRDGSMTPARPVSGVEPTRERESLSVSS